MGRDQLIAAGLTRTQAWQNVRNGRWRTLGRGVYATFTGPVDARMLVWAALLTVGEPVAASHRTALWLDGLLATPPDVVHLSVPAHRRVRSPPGAQVHRRRDFESLVRPAASPPRLRLEASLLDALDRTASVDSVLNLVFSATQRRMTTAQRLRSNLATRSRHRWRSLLGEVLADVEEGVASPLERRYLRDVERPHGLPRGKRNSTETDSSGRSQYKDVRYGRWRTLVELDGRGAHPVHEQFRDWRRDNTAVIADEETLRYGWHDVISFPCQIAGQVAVVLQRNGWTGNLARCPRCP